MDKQQPKVQQKRVKNKDQKKKYRENQQNGEAAKLVYQNINNMKGNHEYQYQKIKNGDYSQNRDFNDYIQQLETKFKNTRNNKLLEYAGQKFADKLEQNFDNLGPAEKHKVLIDILADDIPPQLLQYALKATPFVAKYLWNVVSRSSLGQKAIKALRNVTGVDLNDDVDGYNNYTYNSSLGKQVDWSEIDTAISDDTSRFDGVSGQSIMSVLSPELISCRFPSQTSTKTGLYSKVSSVTITTNAAGNAIMNIFPEYIASTTTFPGFHSTYNDTTLNINTGVQTPACTSVAGPMFGLVGFQEVRVTGFVVQLQSIVSQLNNQGRVVTVMSNSNVSGNTTTSVSNLASARDREYSVYTSMSNINGHRLVYLNNTTMPGTFGDTSSDFISIIVTGCQPSAQVLQVNMHYNVEYTLSPGSIGQIECPPLGPFTQQCLQSALSRRPELRLLGSQEIKSLLCEIMGTRNVYENVYKCLSLRQFQHKHDEVNINPHSNSGDMQSASREIYSAY